MIRTLARVPAQAGAAPKHHQRSGVRLGFRGRLARQPGLPRAVGGTAGELRRTAAR
jgi:hypothetical protein